MFGPGTRWRLHRRGLEPDGELQGGHVWMGWRDQVLGLAYLMPYVVDISSCSC
jgi:hypothetical protein